MQNSFSYERSRTKTRFETEAQENSEMAYCQIIFAKNQLVSLPPIGIFNFYCLFETVASFNVRDKPVNLLSLAETTDNYFYSNSNTTFALTQLFEGCRGLGLSLNIFFFHKLILSTFETSHKATDRNAGFDNFDSRFSHHFTVYVLKVPVNVRYHLQIYKAAFKIQPFVY